MATFDLALRIIKQVLDRSLATAHLPTAYCPSAGRLSKNIPSL
jgi:hypothetical protein